MPPLPRFPLYIPSKSRADICLTAHALDRMGVPYRFRLEKTSGWHKGAPCEVPDAS